MVDEYEQLVIPTGAFGLDGKGRLLSKIMRKRGNVTVSSEAIVQADEIKPRPSVGRYVVVLQVPSAQANHPVPWAKAAIGHGNI